MAIFYINYILWYFCLFNLNWVYSFPLVKKKRLTFILCVWISCLHVCMCTTSMHCSWRPKRSLDLIKLELEMVVNQLIRVWENHPRSSKRASALNSWALPSSPFPNIKYSLFKSGVDTLFCERSNSKYFRLCWPHSLHWNALTLSP